MATTVDDKLLLMEEEWAAQLKKTGEAYSSRGGNGKHRGEASLQKKVDPNACQRCGKTGQRSAQIASRRRRPRWHDVEGKEKGEATAVEERGRALKTLNLDEQEQEQEQRWYLDSGARNHMTGSKAAFSELDENVTGTVKFGDGSRVTIRGRGTIILRC